MPGGKRFSCPADAADVQLLLGIASLNPSYGLAVSKLEDCIGCAVRTHTQPPQQPHRDERSGARGAPYGNAPSAFL
jgi:hypothetical protein